MQKLHLSISLLLALATNTLGSCAASETATLAHAQAIHGSILTLDTHKDINPDLALTRETEDAEALRKWRLRTDPTVDGTNQVDFPKMRKGGYDCAFFIVYVGQGRNDGAGFIRAKREAMSKFNAIDRMVKKYPGDIALARTADDVRRIHASGRLVACIGIENGYPMGEDLGLIEEFHDRGARYMGIAHNRHSQLGDSHTPAEPLHGGLSDLGRQAVAELNRVGIMVDISHSSKATMMQTLAISRAPVIASHSGCAAVRAHGRNLDDEQLLALKKNGGVIQCVALGSFVKDDSARRAAMAKIREETGAPDRREMYVLRNSGSAIPPEVQATIDAYDARVKAEVDTEFAPADVADFVDHIDHAVNLIGLAHVAISSDFDGGGGVVGWNNAAETFNVTHELVRRGYTKDQIEALWSGNTLRVWDEVEAVAKKIQAEGK